MPFSAIFQNLIFVIWDIKELILYELAFIIYERLALLMDESFRIVAKDYPDQMSQSYSNGA